jgi:predicted ATP-dependent protease
MPLNVKVVLVGERILYYLLKEYDPEFDELFKVGADFESDVARNESNTRSYGRFLGTLARHYGLRPFDRHAGGAHDRAQRAAGRRFGETFRQHAAASPT